MDKDDDWVVVVAFGPLLWLVLLFLGFGLLFDSWAIPALKRSVLYLAGYKR